VIAVELITLTSPIIRVYNNLQVELETQSSTELPGEPATTSNTATSAQQIAEERITAAGASEDAPSVEPFTQPSSDTTTASTTAGTTVDEAAAPAGTASTTATVGGGMAVEEASEQQVRALKLSPNATLRV
jgi:hypothetical protein